MKKLCNLKLKVTRKPGVFKEISGLSYVNYSLNRNNFIQFTV